MHGTQQVFLAAKYLAQFWPEAKTELNDGDARILIWAPVYNCTRMLMPEKWIPELEDTFRGLYKTETVR